MIFGRPSVFAIECELDLPIADYVYGRLGVWVGGTRLGTFNTEILTIDSGTLSRSLWLLSEMRHSDLEFAPTERCLSTIWRTQFGTDDYDAELATLYSPNFWLGQSPAFDHVRSVVLDTARGLRLIFATKDDAPQETTVSRVEYVGVVNAFLEWLEKETGFRHAPPQSVRAAMDCALKEGRKAQASRNRERKQAKQDTDRRRSSGSKE